MDCWKEYGSPSLQTPEVLEAASLINEVYAFHGAGGYLHIVVDDWNLEDDSIDFCIKLIAENPYASGSDPEETSVESLNIQSRCANLLRGLSIEQRASALAITHHFVAAEVPVFEGD